MKSTPLTQSSEMLCQPLPRWLRGCSTATLVASVGLLCVTLFAYDYRAFFAASLLPSILAALTLTLFLSIYLLRHLGREHREADQAFRDTDCEFSSIFQNVLDGILIVDDDADCLDANPAAADILRLSIHKLIGQNVGRFFADHHDFTQRWKSFLRNKKQRGRAQLIAGDGATLFVDFTAAANYLPGRHVLIVCDVTERTRAESEAEALRKSTLALSQNLAMDSVLDTLLQCISELVPFDRATVLFVEDGFELMIAREAPCMCSKRIGLTLTASENVFLQRVLFEKKAMLVPEVAKEGKWRDVPPLDQLHSWLGIPLVAAGRVLGILSLGSNAPHIFTSEHLRMAKSLAVPAAVAIQNARVHERAEIYAAELEVRLHQLHEAQKALEHLERKQSRPRHC
jgi:PAS domain S-box-containing protein